MINFCLSDEEKSILKSTIGKKLLRIKHDPLDKFGGETVYGRIELFLEDVVILINYDYSPYRLFDAENDDRPKFSIKTIPENEAVSALQSVEQIYVNCNETIAGITLVEDYSIVEWDSKKDNIRVLTAIIFKCLNYEFAIQGDYMIPLLEIVRGEDIENHLSQPGEEFKNDSETKSKSQRFFVDLGSV